jgi:thiamine-monophosphate kinase
MLIGDSDSIISRSGARDGDGVFVTDTLGDSAMGLMLLKRIGKKIPIKTQNCKSQITNFKIGNSRFAFQEVFPLLKRHLMPGPRPLKNTSGVTSMIDVSDGLLMDLSHICDESKVGVVIYKNKIPISRGLANIAKDIGTDPFTFALKGGEDYVLLFTAPSNVKTKAFRIGEIVKKGRFLIDTRGRKIPFKPEGYEHFK